MLDKQRETDAAIQEVDNYMLELENAPEKNEIGNGDPEETYRGAYLEGKYHGFGRVIKRHEAFAGTFKYGVKHGLGKYINGATGELYIGNYNYGIFQGQGVHILANKEKYDGQFDSGSREGNGTWWKDHTDPSHSLRYEGQWKHGMMNGIG